MVTTLSSLFVSPQVDQYAYSMTLIEIATGQLPWTLGAMEVIKRVRAGKRSARPPCRPLRPLLRYS